MNTAEFWQDHEEAARQRAVDALHDDVTADELVAAVKTLADELREIPPRMRAVAAASQIADELVEVLTAAGVAWANPDNAPAQIAGTLLAAWMEADGRADDGVEWLHAVGGCLPGAIEWARSNGDMAEPWACEAVQRVVGDQ